MVPSPEAEPTLPHTRGVLTIALAGNPNSGKTTIFNNLTGARQHVGNYPGVTVEKKEGVCTHRGLRIRVVDLPGTYSLTPYSTEEIVARDFIIDERPDVVVDVVDASNLERNLYLTTQLIPLGVPIVVALNMTDVAERRGFAIDTPRLAGLLGTRIAPTVGHKSRGTAELLEAVVAAAEGRDTPTPVEVTYGREIEEEIAKLIGLLDAETPLTTHYAPRWLAVKLLEDDKIIHERIQATAHNAPALFQAAAASRHHLHTIFGDSPETIVADRRYGFISGACQEAVTHTVEARHSTSDRIDSIVMHRLLGVPIFLLLTYLTFQFTFSLGDLPTQWIETLFGWLSGTVAGLWPKASESWLRALLTDGVIAGVGGVLTFVPYIMLLFFAIAVLEDSGYMARAAFISDRMMHLIGLHGKSFIPMLLGFGCSVPAILATRTLDTRRDRLTTMLVVPLMSCSARLVIYTVIIGAFFHNRILLALGPLTLRLQPLMFFTIYLIGIILAILAARLLRATILRGETTPLVMELPPYRVPTLRGLLIHMWERSWLYIKKAGTVILLFSIILWALTTYPKKTTPHPNHATRRHTAHQAYIAAMRQLAQPLGIAPHAPTLARLAQAQLDLHTAADQFYPHEPGYKQALAHHQATLAQLRQHPAWPPIGQFLEACNTTRTIRHSYAQAISALGTPPHAILSERTPGMPTSGKLDATFQAALLLAHHRDSQLDKLQAHAPGPYTAALEYLDHIQPALDTTRETLANEHAADTLAWSVAGRIGKAIEPLLRPLGFDWKIGTALIGAFGAKEVFVAQMGIVYAVGADEQQTEALRQRLRADYSPLTGFCIMLFCLISMPCVATIAATRRESGSWRWALFQLGGLTLLAYTLTLITYQLGTLLGLGVG